MKLTSRNVEKTMPPRTTNDHRAPPAEPPPTTSSETVHVQRPPTTPSTEPHPHLEPPTTAHLQHLRTSDNRSLPMVVNLRPPRTSDEHLRLLLRLLPQLKTNNLPPLLFHIYHPSHLFITHTLELIHQTMYESLCDVFMEIESHA